MISHHTAFLLTILGFWGSAQTPIKTPSMIQRHFDHSVRVYIWRIQWGVAKLTDSNGVTITSKSSPASSSKASFTSCLSSCPRVFSSWSYCSRPSGRFATWLLIYHQSKPCSSHFVTMGEPDSWGSIINSLRAALRRPGIMLRGLSILISPYNTHSPPNHMSFFKSSLSSILPFLC